MAATQPLAQATGRRKTSVARVRLYPGEGRFVLNGGRSLDDYFPERAYRIRILEPFQVVGLQGRYDVHAKLEGGGLTGQADALRLGIARALVALDPDLRPALKREGLLTRDARVVERKKYGLRKARRAPQYTKR
ncbi:MAG TPA: 30S ribosomal protein S9 [Actinobacteria bacterium]|nr:30S ribosomal protein S9 [Actinomycetota bacterium]